MFVLPDPGYVAFVAKAQKSKTRKGKDYFVFRITLPKDTAEKIDVNPGDYIFFRAKKAQWYHMLDWTQMQPTWQMLPAEIQREVALSGLSTPTGAGEEGTLPEMPYIFGASTFGGTQARSATTLELAGGS